MILEQDKDIPVPHGFFGRKGGISEGIYAGLNCGPGSGDRPDFVARNRARVAAQLGVESPCLLGPHQVHGNICVHVTDPFEPSRRPQADALVTDVPGLALSVLTADCAPVLFYGRKSGGEAVVGVAHAGWRGALQGVLETTLEKIQEAGARRETVRAAVGPCIGRRSYTVSRGFERPFLTQNPENEQFFQPAQAHQDGHLMFDLPGYCASRIAGAGIASVFVSALDTYENEKGCYSYRRSIHRNEPDYGRQISAILIKN